MSMEINSGKSIPEPIGPYSVAASFEKLVFTSGQIGIDAETGKMPETVEKQTGQALENLKAVLESQNSSLGKVLKTTVFLNSMKDFNKMNEVYAKYFSADFPARSAVEVARLPKDALVEIEAIAIKE